MQRIIAQRVVNTKAHLQEVLDQFVQDEADAIYITNADGEPVLIKLFEETLTDGSIVYNLVIS